MRSKDELYCPTPCASSMRLLLARAHLKGHDVVLFDISRAFLHTPIRSRVVVRPPAEWDGEQGTVWLQNCALYGLNEGMVDFDTFFEEVVTGRVPDDGRTRMEMSRLISDSVC